MVHDTILILDFGSQTTQLIAKRIREHGIYAVILPYSTPLEEITNYRPKGIVFSGGPRSVAESNAPHPDGRVFDLGIPLLGICYGLQLIANHFGADVQPATTREYGKTELQIQNKKDSRFISRLFKNVPQRSTVWMSHQDAVLTQPLGFHAICTSQGAPFAGIQNNHIMGVQFHPEVTHTQYGSQLLKNFCIDICGCTATWQPGSVVQEIIDGIHDAVHDRTVLHAVSGGVDSTVLAVLLHAAIGDRATNIFVNTGLMRKNEPQQILEAFQKINLPVRTVDAQDRFLSALQGKTDPEEKRIAVGDTFLDVFFEFLQPSDMLSQGTLYPDVIESISVKGPSDTIKSHHNMVPRTENLRRQKRILEPFKALFKDDVRKIGEELGISQELIMRHPSPGPDGAIRIIGEVTPNRLRLRNEADAIFIEELRNAGLYNQVSQAFAALSNDKAVGVMGDCRTYGYMVFLRAVVTDNFMTADWASLPEDLLKKVSNRIVNEVPGITRVLYDVTQKPPGTICYM